MPSLNTIRLMTALKGGFVLGPELQTRLGDGSVLSGFNEILTMRGETRALANSALSMTAFALSPRAITAIFGQASALNSTAVQAIANSAIGMTASGTSLPILNAANTNPVAWPIFTASATYGANVKNIIATFAGVTPTLYATADALIVDPVSMGLIVASARGMFAVVASPSTVATMAGNSPAMAVVAANTLAIGVVAANTATMPTIANSAAAMTEINSRSAAVGIMANNAGAIKAIYASAGGWTSIKASPHFAANLPAIMANLAGLSPANFPTIDSIIANGPALAAVAANTGAVEALAASSSAMTTLGNSANFSVVASSANAMAVLANSTAIVGLLNNNTSLAVLFANSAAKGAMFTSTIAINAIASSASAVAFLRGKATTAFGTTVPNGIGKVGAFEPFGGGVPAKLLTLAARQAGIAATFAAFQYGTPVAGAQAGAALSLTGAAALAVDQFPFAHVATYANLTVKTDAAVIAITGVSGILYIDMT